MKSVMMNASQKIIKKKIGQKINFPLLYHCLLIYSFRFQLSRLYTNRS